MDVLKKVPVREQDAKVRAANFEEVCLGYNREEAMEEASRCINCKNAQCVKGCPVSINIPGFIEKVKESIQRQTEEQKEALEKIRELSAAIATMETPEQAQAISDEIQTLTKMQQAGIKKQFKEKLDELKIKYDKNTNTFIAA